MELYWKLLCLWLFTRQWVLAQDPRPNTVRFELTLTWEEWAPAGIPREMILSNGQLPAPTLELRQGDNVEFLVNNQLPFSTTVHFHGSLPLRPSVYFCSWQLTYVSRHKTGWHTMVGWSTRLVTEAN